MAEGESTPRSTGEEGELARGTMDRAFPMKQRHAWPRQRCDPRWRQPQARTFFIECVSEDEMLAWIRAIENEEQRVGLAHALLLPPHAAVAARERTRTHSQCDIDTM